jgi:uncharacterized SAM-binding protein YcdF (DUF218 family)
MFAVKSLITPFLLPPGIFVLALVLFGSWLLLKKQGKAALLGFAIGGSLWLLSIAPVSDALMKGLESVYQIPRDLRGDVIILLGGGIHEDVEDLSGIGAPSEETLARIVSAVRLQKAMDVPVIVSGGTVPPYHNAEAPVDKRFLEDLGVPAAKILTEEKSRDTSENARYAKDLCEQHHFKKPLLVTSAYHMERAVWCFRKLGMDITPFPANFHASRDRKYPWRDYLPSNISMMNTYSSLHEYLGLVFYRIFK